MCGRLSTVKYRRRRPLPPLVPASGILVLTVGEYAAAPPASLLAVLPYPVMWGLSSAKRPWQSRRVLWRCTPARQNSV